MKKDEWLPYLKVMVNRFTLMFTLLFTGKYLWSFFDSSVILDIPGIYKEVLVLWLLIPVYEYFFQRRKNPHTEVPS